jgi:hypothetical protein
MPAAKMPTLSRVCDHRPQLHTALSVGRALPGYEGRKRNISFRAPGRRITTSPVDRIPRLDGMVLSRSPSTRIDKTDVIHSDPVFIRNMRVDRCQGLPHITVAPKAITHGIIGGQVTPSVIP